MTTKLRPLRELVFTTDRLRLSVCDNITETNPTEKHLVVKKEIIFVTRNRSLGQGEVKCSEMSQGELSQLKPQLDFKVI